MLDLCTLFICVMYFVWWNPKLSQHAMHSSCIFPFLNLVLSRLYLTFSYFSVNTLTCLLTVDNSLTIVWFSICVLYVCYEIFCGLYNHYLWFYLLRLWMNRLIVTCLSGRQGIVSLVWVSVFTMNDFHSICSIIQHKLFSVLTKIAKLTFGAHGLEFPPSRHL